jgi:hypothetical protein
MQIIWFSIAMWFVNEFLKIISPGFIKFWCKIRT